ncbi:aryl hydrocarbon receptor-like [Lampris incognitus]|uniref:aryl hydrocarbon receptor-like n=1 Tax=Lampris incognitus TaxID=2546036 RepID=UPI0024B581AB|nr:aryl hydrocarbon receptor-like [Lampris incognitus]
MYAGRKRRKPVQRTVKQPPAEGVKSNPSKRHRDRLNGELERLASLLPFPEEVTSSLDKLSILRLSVSYLRAKNFFSVALKSHTCNGAVPNGGNNDNGKAAGLTDTWLPEGEFLLQALNGFVLVVTADGAIFYSSHTIQDYLGFHQTDVMHQSVYELVHTEDQQELRRNLHWALNPHPATLAPVTQESPQELEPDSSTSLVTYNPEQLPPENSSFLERSFVCRFRCLLDNSSGFLALNLQGRLKFLHGQNQRQENGGKVPPQLALFAIATPLQPPSILEIRTKNMIFRTKHKLDFTPMACDAKGKIVLGYTEAELRVKGSGYQFIHAADMLYCAENHVRMMKTGESGLTVFRLLTKDNRWKWVQANARLVYKNGKPDYIIATQRPLVEEEGGEHLRKRSLHLPFTYATGEALLYQSNHPIAGFIEGTHEKNGSKSKKSRTDRVARDGLDPGSLLGALMSQDESVYVCQPALEPKLSFHSSFFGEQMGFSEPEPSNLHRSWEEPSNSMVGLGLPEPTSSFDPLLATLDSLSLAGQGVAEADEQDCSNRELFGALEGLGLSAEDLELLLLDERMIRVEMDPDHVPTLDDLLTNDEILSYIHESLEAKNDSSSEMGGQVPPTVASVSATASATATTASPPEGNVTSATSMHTQFPPLKPPPVGQTPIVQLSQQMQQHLSTRPGKVVREWGQQNNYLTNSMDSEGLLGQSSPISNGQWSAQGLLANAGIPVERCHPQQTVYNGKAPELNRELCQGQANQLYLQQQPRAQSQRLQPCHAKPKGANPKGLCSIPNTAHLATKAQWQDYSFAHTEEGLSGTPCLSNGRAALSNVSLDTCGDYSMPDIEEIDSTINGGGTYGGSLHHQHSTSYQKVNHKCQQEQLPPPLAQVLSSLSQCPPPNATLEQILGVCQPCRQLDPYNVVTAEIPYNPDHSKIENGCILNSAYPGGCALTNGNGTAPPKGQIPVPDPLSSLPDPQATGFYL